MKVDKKITMLTCYDYVMAKLMDSAEIDYLLVGDSLGMVFQGKKDTLSVTIDEIIYHTKAVRNGATKSKVISDMPFMSYPDARTAVHNAGRCVKEASCDMVKLEGGARVIDQIKAIVKAEIPVCGHIGLTPQSIKAFGGFKVQGRDDETAKKVLEDAKAVEEAGASMIVLEAIPKKLAKKITETLTIPTIGIGAGKYCDGQVLVYQDMLGMYGDFVPKFVKKYAGLGKKMTKCFKEFKKEVEAGIFPDDEHSFK